MIREECGSGTIYMQWNRSRCFASICIENQVIGVESRSHRDIDTITSKRHVVNRINCISTKNGISIIAGATVTLMWLVHPLSSTFRNVGHVEPSPQLAKSKVNCKQYPSSKIDEITIQRNYWRPRLSNLPRFGSYSKIIQILLEWHFKSTISAEWDILIYWPTSLALFYKYEKDQCLAYDNINYRLESAIT